MVGIDRFLRGFVKHAHIQQLGVLATIQDILEDAFLPLYIKAFVSMTEVKLDDIHLLLASVFGIEDEFVINHKSLRNSSGEGRMFL